MGILQDITDKLLYEMELKQREQVLAGTAERLEEANIALRTLLEVFNKEKEQLANQVTASVRDNLAPTSSASRASTRPALRGCFWR
jgi:hypothetical protein